MKKPLVSAFLALLGALLPVLPAAAHDHFAAGIINRDVNNQPIPGGPLQLLDSAGQPLVLLPGGIVNKTFHLLARPTGYRTTAPFQYCGGYYSLDERPRTLFPADSFSFTALSDGQIEAAAPLHAHTGARIWMEIVSVSGPPGATFGFWESNWSASNDSPSSVFATNQPVGENNLFILSESFFDDAGEDPQGHIHGRAWSADQPGTYLVGFRLVDLSANRPGGLPWHTPSQIYYFRFEAGPSFQPVVQRVGATCKLTWSSQMGTSDLFSQPGIPFTIERATMLNPPNWQPIGTVTGTTGATATFTDSTPPAGKAFYRLNYNWAPQ
jgi:hypothetical protein